MNETELEYFLNKLANLHIKLLDHYANGDDAQQTKDRIINIEKEIDILLDEEQ